MDDNCIWFTKALLKATTSPLSNLVNSLFRDDITLFGDWCSSYWLISSDHDHFYSCRAALKDGIWYCIFGWISERENSNKYKTVKKLFIFEIKIISSRKFIFRQMTLSKSKYSLPVFTEFFVRLIKLIFPRLIFLYCFAFIIYVWASIPYSFWGAFHKQTIMRIICLIMINWEGIL